MSENYGILEEMLVCHYLDDVQRLDQFRVVDLFIQIPQIIYHVV